MSLKRVFQLITKFIKDKKVWLLMILRTGF